MRYALYTMIQNARFLPNVPNQCCLIVLRLSANDLYLNARNANWQCLPPRSASICDQTLVSCREVQIKAEYSGD